MLDVIVLIAMAVTAAAFAVGLVLHSGIAQIPALYRLSLGPVVEL